MFNVYPWHIVADQNSSVGIVNWLRAERLRNRFFIPGRGIFLFPKASKPPLGPTQPPVERESQLPCHLVIYTVLNVQTDGLNCH